MARQIFWELLFNFLLLNKFGSILFETTFLISLSKNVEKKLEKSPQLITSSSFQKFIFSVTGKDIKDLLDLWVKRGGVTHITASFTFDRKRNSVEIEIRQDHAGSVRYVGPIIGYGLIKILEI